MKFVNIWNKRFFYSRGGGERMCFPILLVGMAVVVGGVGIAYKILKGSDTKK